MQFISFFKPGPDAGPDRMAELDAFVRRQAEAGHLILGGGFKDGEPGFRMSLENGDFAVREGAPASEALGVGFGILKADSQEQMMQFVREFLTVSGGGECAVRILADGPPPQ